MNHHEDAFTPAEREQLEQELLELHFGCHEQPERLQARLAAEPALRALQERVLQQARVLEEAVRPEAGTLELPTPAPASRWRLLRHPVGRLLAAAALAATVVLAFFVAERLATARLTDHRRDHLHLTIAAPRAVPAGAPWSFTVQAQDLAGDPTACRVRWQTFGEGNSVLAAGEAPLTGGTATVALPADLRAPQRVEVVASSATDEVRQVLPLSPAHAGPLVHVTTDRPVYRPNETVYVRIVVLDRVTLLPRPLPVAVAARLLDAKGAPVATAPADITQGGAVALALAVPHGSAGGPHRIEITAQDGSFPAEFAEIVVRSFQAPKLETTIVLDRATYAPGAHGSALVQVQRMGGGAAAGAAAKAVVVIDGSEAWSDQVQLDAKGEARFRFAIPPAVAAGAARFVATVTDGGVVETELKPFVVPTGKVLVAGFPEGGELVAGVENNVYLECQDPLGRAVDTGGDIHDDRGQQVAKFRTVHQGRVRVAFTPRAGRTYSVRIAGQPDTTALPAVRDTGIAMRLPGDGIAADAPLRLSVAGRGDGPWLLGVFCRGVLVGQTTLRPDERGELHADALVSLPATAAGVLRATVFDRNLAPVAERLLRRAAAHRVDVELVSQHAALSPGDLQQITVRTKNENGDPVAAALGLTVTDQAVVSLGSEPRIGLADHATLFADVERTENLGDFLLGNPDGARNADLLLGTRGWRRFVWRNDEAARQAILAKGLDVTTVLAREGLSQTPQVTSNLHAANAPGEALAGAAHRAGRNLRDAAGLAATLLAALALLELLLVGFGLLVRNTGLPGWVPAGAAVAALCMLVFGTTSLLQRGEEAKAVADAELMDFAPAPEARWADLPVVILNAPKPPEVDPQALVFFARNGVQDKLEEAAIEVVHGEVEVPARGLAQVGFKIQDGRGGGGPGAPLARERAAVSREYAHRRTPHAGRSDFAPTIFFHGMLTTNAAGEATIAFATSDAVTTWLVQADAHGTAGPIGRVGQQKAQFQARLPFHLEAKLPDELSAGDRLLLPIAAIVEGGNLAEVAVEVTLGNGLLATGAVPASIALRDGRGRLLLPIGVDAPVASALIRVEGKAGAFADRVEHTLRVAPRGFPHQRSAGGTVASDAPATFVVGIPADAVPGSGRVVIKLFPSPLSALTEGLQGILQEPCGCFEQASSSNYPNTLVLTLLDASGDNVPALAARARELLGRGYSRITGYECKQKGYEWFGGDPGHEALTAYGLLQFDDMRKVHDVDQGMVERTQQWLLARRDGKGGYQRNDRALDSFGRAPQPITDAYVTYALLQAGVPAAQLQQEIEALVRRMATKDPYELAVIACALQLAGRPEAALSRRSLADLQQADGSLRGTTSSITSSGGRDLAVETTGFSVLAWLPDPAHSAHVRRAVEFLQACRGASGTFGATQATIQALRALTAYAQANRAMREPGTLRVYEDDRLLAERTFAAGDVEAISFDLWNQLAPGAHTLRLQLEGGGQPLPWAADVAYFSDLPADDPDARLTITTTLRSRAVVEGGTIALDVAVSNVTADGLPMAMAIVGLPAGLELPTRVLEDLQKAGAFAFWELRGRELALYWRDLAPEAVKNVTLDLVARIPGKSTGPASRTYLYYTPAQKRWAAGLAIEVTPR